MPIACAPRQALQGRPASLYLDASNKKVGEGAVTVQAALVSPGIKQQPQISAQGIGNSASFQLPIAPGAFVSVFGRSLSRCLGESAKALPLTDNLCKTQVLFNGKAGSMYYASDSQLIALVPYSTAPGKALKIPVHRCSIRRLRFSSLPWATSWQ